MSLEVRGENEEQEYIVDEDVRRLEPPPPLYSIALIAAFGAVFVAQIATGLEHSVEVAGFDKQAFIYRNEYWRMLTGAALHGGLLHVAMNGYALYSFGRIFEMLSARAHLVIVFVLSAVGGGLLSLVAAPDGVSVGASGGIVGLIGYLAVYAFKRREFISPEFRRSLLINIGFILVYGILLYQIVDNYGHIGGLIAGAAYAFIQVPTDPYVDPRTAGPAMQIVGLASLGLYIATCVLGVLLITARI